MADLSKLTMYAWVGEDEYGSGVIGLKQGITPAGCVPLAAMGHHLDRLAKVLPQLEQLVSAIPAGDPNIQAKRMYLIKFTAVEIAGETKGGQPWLL